MTAPSPATIDREADKLYLTDMELIRRLGIPERDGRKFLRSMDDNPRSGFPKKQPLFGGRRYWRAIEAWLDRNNGLNPQP